MNISHFSKVNSISANITDGSSVLSEPPEKSEQEKGVRGVEDKKAEDTEEGEQRVKRSGREL